MLEEAINYYNLGYSVIPCNKQKKPIIEWKQYQTEKATKEQIEEWWNHWPEANIGIVTGSISNLTVIDIDSVEGLNKVKELLPTGFKTPTVTTPSGFFHLWCRDAGVGNSTGIVKGTDVRGQGGYIVAPPSSNGNGKGYTWKYYGPDGPLQPFPEGYKVLINSKPLKDISDLSFEDGTRDESLFSVANSLAKGGMPRDSAYAIIAKLAKTCDPPETPRKAKEKVDSAYTRHHVGNIAHDTREWTEAGQGSFTTSDIYRDLCLVTRAEKKACHHELRRLVANDIIEKDQMRVGSYRIINNDEVILDWKVADTTPIDVIMPLGLNSIVTLMPGNIIVLAGCTNAGKTSFALNFVKLNQRRWPGEIFFFTSEMGAAEMRYTINKFKDIKEDEWDFKAINKSSNFSESIRPDGINIIDYLELHENHYLVSKDLLQIHNKLNNGIALVNIQKNPDVEVGLGGYRGMEKPRLYITLGQSDNICNYKIQKAKNWANPKFNPNGKEAFVRILDNNEFMMLSEWQ